MTRHIVLDSFPLSAITHPKPGTEAKAITQWVNLCLAGGHKIYVPEVIDYELRRELLRAGKGSGLVNLNAANSKYRYIPITTTAMRLAADLWARSRRSGFTTAHPMKIDVDVILIAQALTLAIPRSDIIIATVNVRHLSHFAPAAEWTNIKP